MATGFLDVVGGKNLVIESGASGWTFDTTAWTAIPLAKANGTQGPTRTPVGVYVPFDNGWSLEFLVFQANDSGGQLFNVASPSLFRRAVAVAIASVGGGAVQVEMDLSSGGSIGGGFLNGAGRHHLMVTCAVNGTLSRYVDGGPPTVSVVSGPHAPDSSYRVTAGVHYDGSFGKLNSASAFGRVAFYDRVVGHLETKRRAFAALAEV